MRTTPYTALIAQTIETQRLNQTAAGPIFEPNHVEAYMRLEHSTLDGLSSEQFTDEVVLACECIQVAGIDEAERLAKTYGLGRVQ